ncbi:hypothetical protein CAQU_00730 [Corynebacterium aquilae DSM 44791]|uniref:Glycosyltransferase RgtA/B/C/D-like domain-containing protein n=2 Tax=Corynebacterium aquilae TaxID=203263 RepID=A0A1L7CDC9_9CORY|nr:hypothetical protein CAQU_00730 [Corynebacterium aquilae DSM 44791]
MPTRTRAVDAFLITALIGAIKLGVLALFSHRTGKSINAALAEWDAKFYMGIAEGGYFHPTQPPIEGPPHERALAFFPAFPALLRALHTISGADYLTLGTTISQILSFVACLGIMTLAARSGLGRTGQIGAGILLLGAPLAITMIMPYSEALFMALSTWALVAIIDRKWLTAGALTMLAGLVRLTAVDLVAVLVLIALYTTFTRGQNLWRAWGAVAISPVGIASYLAYANHHLANAGGYFTIQRQGWHSYFDFGAATLRFLARVSFDNTSIIGYYLSAVIIIAAAIAVPATWPSVKRATLPVEIWLFGAAVAANMLLSDGIMHSRPRLLLPAYLLLIPLVGEITHKRSRPAQVAIATAYVAFGAWMSAYFLTVFPWAI